MNSEVVKRRIAAASLLALSPALLYTSYLAIKRAGLAVLYKPVHPGTGRILRDVVYCEGSENKKHRLDLYVPDGTNWPIFIFVHGGSLDSGDKCLRVCGADVYGNIGRFYASNGIGVAVINYRLQPEVTWREQVADVASATRWAFLNVTQHGGDPSRLFVGGHSAGAHLATRIALDPKPLAQFGLSPAIIKGVVAVSGAAFDLTDDETYKLGRNLALYEARFRCGDPTDEWRKIASPLLFAAPSAPPFLIIYSAGETKALQRQSQLLHAALREKQIQSELLVVPGQNHCRMVLTLSRPDKMTAPAILDFIRKTGSLQLSEPLMSEAC